MLQNFYNVILSGAETPSTEYQSECEYEKKFYKFGASAAKVREAFDIIIDIKKITLFKRLHEAV